MFTLEGIDHVALSVRNVEQAVDWYCDLLGFAPLHQDKWDGIPKFIGKGSTGIAFSPVTQPVEKSPGLHSIAMRHLAFRATRENFEAAQAALSQRGISFQFEDHEIAHSIYFRDPDGHLLEITTYDVERKR